jgi:hypothetical protein
LNDGSQKRDACDVAQRGKLLGVAFDLGHVYVSSNVDAKVKPSLIRAPSTRLVSGRYARQSAVSATSCPQISRCLPDPRTSKPKAPVGSATPAVHIARLVDSVKKLVWRHGAVRGGDVTHLVDERGDHHIDITIAANVAEYDPPKRHDGLFLGHSTPEPKK